MDKLVAIRIKYDDDTYSDEIPLSVLGKYVDYSYEDGDNVHSLV